MSEKSRTEAMLNSAATNQPVLLGTAIVQFISVALVAVASFGFDLSDAQQDAIWQLLGAFSIFLWSASAWVKHATVPNAKNEAQVKDALYTPVPENKE